jgi:hypothetical protein
VTPGRAAVAPRLTPCSACAEPRTASETPQRRRSLEQRAPAGLVGLQVEHDREEPNAFAGALQHDGATRGVIATVHKSDGDARWAGSHVAGRGVARSRYSRESSRRPSPAGTPSAGARAVCCHEEIRYSVRSACATGVHQERARPRPLRDPRG